MKFGSTPPPPPDDAADPLLAALRQRLGDYGQAPPPGAWAAIRQQLGPMAPARPWWRRPSRLLPVLGLLVGWLLPGILGEPLHRSGLNGWSVGGQLARLPHRSAAIVISGKVTAPQRHPAVASAAVKRSLALHALGSVEASSDAATKRAAAPATHPGNSLLATTTTSVAAKRPGPPATLHQAELSTGAPLAFASNTNTHARRKSARVASANTNQQLSVEEDAINSASTDTIATMQLTEANSTAATAALISGKRRAKKQAATSQRTTSSTSASDVDVYRKATAPRLASKDRSFSRAQVAARSQARHPGSHPPVAAVTQESFFSRAGTAASEAARPVAGHSYSSLSLLEPADSLALKQTSLLLPAPVPPAVLAARPDSTTSVAHPVRPWALLLVAGPTLSYRTLGPAPTLAAGHPDFARLERPALGLGAQVQVRRVLSGRWALAVGVGYHEYATRLALAFKDSAASVHQRDTYRLLTVPVQLSYALGAPKGRLTKALLLGTEPGWYIGGRSTEGADCGCHQQAYSATGSPYRTWSLAFSLGLDLRYRVGGAASRWQWLVQPTGRYMATPFVRSDAVGFTRRQPWSLGLMTGFSWDVR